MPIVAPITSAPDGLIKKDKAEDNHPPTQSDNEPVSARRTGHGHGLADRDLCGCTGRQGREHAKRRLSSR
jgi:hypothetical protein